MTERTSAAEALLPRPLVACLALALLGVLAAAVAVPAMAARPGHYSDSQVQAGKQDFNAHCAVCHGGQLQGGAGPALKGQRFATSMSFGKMSTTQLFDFVSKHMPKNDPGSLSQQQYLDILAYLLQQNGFAAGSTALQKKTLDQVTLLPLPADGGSGGAATGSGQ